MRKWMFRTAWVVASVIAVVAGIFAIAWSKTQADLARVYVVKDPPLPLRGDAAERERGEHLYAVTGCVECHGEGGVGKVFIDAGPVAFVVAPNLTPAALADRYDSDAIGAAIRHGVGADGRALRAMPSPDFMNLSDQDTAALVAYLQALPRSNHSPGTTEIRPLGRVLALFGKFHLEYASGIDHAPRQRPAPPMAATAEYGAYLAQVCTGCHGMAWTGQRVPGTPPELPPAPNLTGHVTGLQGWTEADFVRVFREGKRPDGGEVHPFMPWRSYSRMSDMEVQAVWRHLQSLPATAGQVRQPPA